MGRPQYIADQDLKLSNDNVNELTGWSEKSITLALNIGDVKTKIDSECGQFDSNLTPHRVTTQFYQMFTVKDEKISIW